VQLQRDKRRLEMEMENEILRRAAACLAVSEFVPKIAHPLVRDLAAEGFPVRAACWGSGYPTLALYARNKNPVSPRNLEDTYAINALFDAHGDYPTFGCRLLGRRA